MTRPFETRSYRSFADFERDELRPLHKVGFSIDDLEAEASFKVAQEDYQQSEREELDFD
ncbi:MAG: hypothetical protein OEZ06_29780 [Myxococcales bacterium]|nr:hypothetical protein [Myxococcales bacterium]